MDNYDNLCMGCMKPLTEGPICPRCKTDNSVPQNYPYLPLKTVLNDQYLVGEMIEHTSDGVTYMGYDLRLKTPVRIREFMPRNLATRIAGNNQIVVTPGKNRDYQECLLNFLELWRSLAKMRELSAIIPVYDIFELYGTAYAVSENMEYVTLRDYLLRSPEGYISWDKARSLLMPVLSTLIALHNNGIIHRAISPTNLVVCKDGKVRLTGFSIWQSNSQQSCLVFQEQSGYNALEQYNNNEKQGPWTDVYGFATTLYRTLVGNNPIDALTRSINDKLMIPARLAEQIPAYVINAMGNALQIHPADRTRTVEQLRNQLSAAPSEAASNSAAVYRQEAEPEPEYEEEEEEEDEGAPATDRRRIIIMSVIAVVLVAAIGILTFFLVRDLRDRQEEEETTTQAEILPVPNFVDYTETEVENNSDWTSNFVFEKEYVFDDEAEAGIIIAQSPESNSNINRGSTIKLTVSKGKETVYLSNFVGVSEEIATAQLEEAGFRVQTATKYNDGSGREGLVYEQSLDSGQSYPIGETIVLIVWGPVQEEEETETTTSLLDSILDRNNRASTSSSSDDGDDDDDE